MKSQNYFQRLKLFTINKWKNDRNKIIFNYIIFFSIAIISILIDLLTKEFLFKFGPMEDGRFTGINQNGGFTHENALFGIRSVTHYGVTFIKGDITYFLWVIHLISIIIFIFTLVVCFYSNSLLLTICLAFMFGGNFGNFFDRVVYGGMVRDILYIPWLRTFNFLSGTFNFADVFIMCGTIFGILFIIKLLVDEMKMKRE
ncbi:MAG: signal peptidase II [Metamycoplasmataceae bacterium]